ncbi:MAG: ParA family protein [Dehalococcoidia bacterium]|nr:ParA family protein [Dehalococcoidia bacterium]
MTRVIALANQKGGVGKTTTAINLGAALAARGQETLIIDVDPQANATGGLGMRAPAGQSTYELMLEEGPLVGVMLRTKCEGLWLAPSTSGLAGAEVELAGMMAREFRLRRSLEGEMERFTFVVIDCPPSVGLLTINALTAAQEVIVPVQCEYLSLEGLGQFSATLELVRRNLNRELVLRGLLLTMYDRRTNLSQQVADEVRRHFPNTFRTVIPRSVRLSESPSHGVPIRVYDATSPAAEAYDALADEVLEVASVATEVRS